MAVQGPIPVEFAGVPARGVRGGEFEPVRDFEASKGGRFVQSKDKVSGLPLWQVDVIDADPAARDKTARVKVAARMQPVLPAPRGDAVRPGGVHRADSHPVRQPGRSAGLLAQGHRGAGARRGGQGRGAGAGTRRREQGGAAGTAIPAAPVSPQVSKPQRGLDPMRDVTGEQIAQVDNPDPFASPVWRSPVYRTPESMIWLVQLLRLLARVVWFVLRHPLLDAAAGLVVAHLAAAGWPGVTVLAACWRALVTLRLSGRTGSPGWCPSRRGTGGGGGSTGVTGRP